MSLFVFVFVFDLSITMGILSSFCLRSAIGEGEFSRSALGTLISCWATSATGGWLFVFVVVVECDRSVAMAISSALA